MRFMVTRTLSRKPMVPVSPVCVLTYFRSAPAQKARPVPVKTTDLTSARFCASLSAWSIPRSTSGVSEFIASGRFRRIHMLPFRTSEITTGVDICLSLVTCVFMGRFCFCLGFRGYGVFHYYQVNYFNLE